MIRFSAALVAVAIGVLLGGIATSKLLLVYIAIVVSAVALVALAIGVVLKREELFGEGQGLVPATAGASPALPARAGESQGRPGKSRQGPGGRARGLAAPVCGGGGGLRRLRRERAVSAGGRRSVWAPDIVGAGTVGGPCIGRSGVSEPSTREPRASQHGVSRHCVGQPSASQHGASGRRAAVGGDSGGTRAVVVLDR